MYVCHTNQIGSTIESPTTNQISHCKGKRYVRRFDPDTVENGHIYSSIKEEEVFIYWVYLNIFRGLG